MTALAAYAAGLSEGVDCWFSTEDGVRQVLPLKRWIADADQCDAGIVAATVAGLGLRAATPCGSVLDVGCGPGRLTAAIAATGAQAVGIDVCAAAVALTRARGAAAVRADVFGAVPGIGRWDRVLLADGNLGIGGNPAALLTRAAELLAPGGRVIADVEPSGGIRCAVAWIEATKSGTDGPIRIGGSLPWAWVGADAAEELARSSKLSLQSVVQLPERCIVVWEKPVGR